MLVGRRSCEEASAAEAREGDLLLDRRVGHPHQHHPAGRALLRLQAPPHRLLQAYLIHEHLLHLQEHARHHASGTVTAKVDQEHISSSCTSY